MNILIACEESGVVREAFKKRGHNAWSCDLKDTAIPGQHIKAPIEVVLVNPSQFGAPTYWDMMIAFPPCTRLCVSGARWFKDKVREQAEAKYFFMMLAGQQIDRIAIENTIGIMSTYWRKPDQIIQPWQFGHGETKATCLWLKNLPKLRPTNIVDGRESRIHKMGPSKERSELRSKTYIGIANAMAEQWG